MPADRTPPTRPDQLAAALRAGDASGTRGGSDPSRPNAILYPAVLAIVLGAAGLFCCGATSGGQGLAVLAHPEAVRPDGQITDADAAVARFMIGIGVVDIVNSAALVVAGIGAMGVRRWARLLGLAVAPLVIAAAGVRLASDVTWLTPYKVELVQLKEQWDAAHPPATQAASQPASTQPSATQPADAAQPTPAEIAARMRQAGPYLSGIMFVVQIAVPILILGLWTRRPVREAFERRR